MGGGAARPFYLMRPNFSARGSVSRSWLVYPSLSPPERVTSGQISGEELSAYLTAAQPQALATTLLPRRLPRQLSPRLLPPHAYRKLDK